MFIDSYHSGADKESGCCKDRAVMRGGLSGSECMLIAIKNMWWVWPFLALLRTLAKDMPEGLRQKQKVSEQRWIVVMPRQHLRTS